jgi:phosphatidylinositol 4-kinase
LEGHWDLPFKDIKLPSPIEPDSGGILSKFRRATSSQPTTPQLLLGGDAATHNSTAFANGITAPLPVNNSGNAPSHLPALDVPYGTSPDPVPRLGQWRSGALSPDVPSRPLSPDGLGNGIFSSVFMDTGVEGLIYESSPLDIHQQQDSMSSSREGSSLVLPDSFDLTGSTGRRLRQPGSATSTGRTGGGRNDGDEAQSPPNSPRRRETTFGATLDFVDALCTASSNLTVFPHEDRDWALHKALTSINAEMDRASRTGVAIWWPMGRSLRQRVVRLAYRESRLLNSREKAPFTLFIEVLNEAAAEAEAEAAAAAAALKNYQNSAASLVHKLPPLPQEMELDPAAAAAAAEGIPWLSHHHRRSSSVDTSSSSLLAATAVTAVQGSTGVDAGLLRSALTPSPPLPPSMTGVQPNSSGAAAGVITTTTAQQQGSLWDISLSSLNLNGGGIATLPVGAVGTSASIVAAPPSLISQRSEASTFATDLSLADFASEASHSPTGKRPFSGGSAHGGDELSLPLGGEGSLPLQGTTCPPSPSPRPPLQHRSPAQGGGHWIGGSNVRIHPSALAPAADLSSGLNAALAALCGVEPKVMVRIHVADDTPLDSYSSTTATKDSINSTAIGSIPLSRTNSGVDSHSSDTGTGGSNESNVSAATTALMSGGVVGVVDAIGAGSLIRRGAVYPEGPAGGVLSTTQQCSKNGWLCKFGLCRTCNALSKTPSQPSTPVSATKMKANTSQKETVTSASLRSVVTAATTTSTTLASTTPAVAAQTGKQPKVKVVFTVQGGINLAIKRAATRHQRMPSHEALSLIAREHKLPVPSSGQLPTTPEAPSPNGSTEDQEQEPERLIPETPAGTTAASASRVASSPDTTSMSTDTATMIGGAATTTTTAATELKSIHGERWSELKTRLRADSPHGNRPGWDLRCVIVKSGDDCRQELLAMQVISTFYEIFAEAQLPVWLRPYEVLVTSNRTALIEMVPNAPSIHAIKSKRAPGTSLREHFVAEFGGEGSPSFKKAQRNFVESMAGYSLLCYLLQIRDRHNANILIDGTGHVVHIDFGFMLSNSPGGVNFESAPFKLTRELLEVMDSDSDGSASELFDYFKVLMIQGFLAVRRHSDRITLLVEMMSDSGCPCFKSKVAAVQGVKKRFALGMPEPQVVEVVLGLISDSLDAWRTRQYDYYQRVLNGIL